MDCFIPLLCTGVAIVALLVALVMIYKDGD
jgi:hypothetical protein